MSTLGLPRGPLKGGWRQGRREDRGNEEGRSQRNVRLRKMYGGVSEVQPWRERETWLSGRRDGVGNSGDEK
ncbi:hypothetical protein E2C01_034981 [Portunus trituberculatus]|uniref:Uncharacterized protein n=1 Tax=Portunus trituberculatus TaxID=210409 RepID=A0A5B7F2Z1_PORTR|nr:hypothetical protein [Portunus trituberculatus]